MQLMSMPILQRHIFRVLALLSVTTFLYTIVEYGFLIDIPLGLTARIVQYSNVLLYILWTLGKVRKTGARLRSYLPDLMIVSVIFITVVSVPVGSGIISFRIVALLFIHFFKRLTGMFLIGSVRMDPARTLLLSFLSVILVGTVLLWLPAATTDRHGTPFVDALFTSTSATCVTGLGVQDTGSYFSLFGQMVILLLIQVGGLGIMTFSTLFAIMLGRRIGLKEEENLRGMLDENSPMEIRRLIFRIIVTTLIIEAAGACLLFVRFLGHYPAAFAAYSAVFHSVSAFCNAGFGLYRDNMVSYASDTLVNVVIIVLIVTGGLGFIVTNDILHNVRGSGIPVIRWHRLSVHTKLVLVTTFALICAGTLGVFFFEFDNAMLHLSTGDKLLAAVFQSVTFRTAGFNTIDIGGCRMVTLFIGILLMIIGASPSSTGGGIKTTTFAVLVLSIKSLFQARDRIEIYNRTIPVQTILKSIAILLFYISFLSLSSIVLLATQTGSFIDIMFEATSAIGTVGLSTGMTGKLNVIGRITITLLMYVGRVGPLSVALAVREPKKVNVSYPETKVSVG
jgi:trk system potassium uptake protein